ncbi:MAG: type II toxin-antitoxin system HicB family antitoxin [Candidatus Babeliales bacterium]
MKYKGYRGHAYYDADARLLHGEVVGLKDVITFQGRDVDELEQAFRDSVEEYLDWCKERGENPEKTFSGNLHLRLGQELHAQLVEQALEKGESLNSFIIEKLRK